MSRLRGLFQRCLLLVLINKEVAVASELKRRPSFEVGQDLPLPVRKKRPSQRIGAPHGARLWQAQNFKILGRPPVTKAAPFRKLTTTERTSPIEVDFTEPHLKFFIAKNCALRIMPGRTTKPEPASQDANMEDAPPSAQPEDAQVEEQEEQEEQQDEEEEEEEVEPQRVKIVSLERLLLRLSMLTGHSCLGLPTLQLHLNSPMRVTHWEMPCATSS